MSYQFNGHVNYQTQADLRVVNAMIDVAVRITNDPTAHQSARLAAKATMTHAHLLLRILQPQRYAREVR